MKLDSSEQIKLGMILSYINLGIGNLIPFFYTPIMLELLGQSEYGLYKIASSTTSYLSLMAFGIGSIFLTPYTSAADVAFYDDASQRSKVDDTEFPSLDPDDYDPNLAEW